MKNLLRDLNAPSDMIEFAKGKSFRKFRAECHRGDWLLWLFAHSNPNDTKLIVLAQALCAATGYKRMPYPESKKAIEIALDFANGKATESDLIQAAIIANKAVVLANIQEANSTNKNAARNYAKACAAMAAESCTYIPNAGYSNDVETNAALSSYAASHAANATLTEREKVSIQLKTSRICRRVLPLKIWNIVPVKTWVIKPVKK